MLSLMARKSAHGHASSRPEALAKISSSPHLYQSAHPAFLSNRHKKHGDVQKREVKMNSRDLPQAEIVGFLIGPGQSTSLYLHFLAQLLSHIRL